MTFLPTPTHLREIAAPLDEQSSKGLLRASIACPCGEARMEFRYPGQTHLWDGREIPCVASIGDKHFLRLEARCVACGRDHLLLDAGFHGWNGLVCHDPDQAALPRPHLVAWPCRECAGLQHRLLVGISVENEEFILEEAEDDIDPARWYDAFGWFTVDATCVRCGRIEQDLISYETM